MGPERREGAGRTVPGGTRAGGPSSNPPPPVGPSAPRISVLIAAHTRVQYLKRAVASAASQGPEEIVV